MFADSPLPLPALTLEVDSIAEGAQTLASLPSARAASMRESRWTPLPLVAQALARWAWSGTWKWAACRSRSAED